MDFLKTIRVVFIYVIYGLIPFVLFLTDEDEESGVEEHEEDDEEGPSEGEDEEADEDDESESGDDSGPDLARGKGNIETSSDEDDDDDELEEYLHREEEDIEHDWGEMWKDAPSSDNVRFIPMLY